MALKTSRINILGMAPGKGRLSTLPIFVQKRSQPCTTCWEKYRVKISKYVYTVSLVKDYAWDVRGLFLISYSRKINNINNSVK